MRKPHSRQKSKSLLESGREFREIITSCLSRIVPIQIQHTYCNSIWRDVNKISPKPQDMRDPGNIKIDSEKFVAAIKHAESRTKELQLIALSKHVISTNPDSIIGTSRYLMLQIIQNDGYQNYINNQLSREAVNSPKTKIFPQISKDAASGTVLLFSAYLSAATCHNSDYKYCFHGVAATSYLLPSEYVQKVLLRRLPKFIDDLTTVSGKALPQFLGHNTKFAVNTIGVKHGNKIVKGAFRAVGPAFDVLSITFAVHDLLKCNDREETDNPCSSKDRRDNIATIGISGVSFVSGSILVATGTAATGWGIGLGFGIIAFTLAYNGISNAIEYDEKYGTTLSEKVKITLLKSLFLDDTEDIQYLARKTDDINKIATYAAEHLQNASFNIVAYAVGLGKVVLFKEVCRNITADSFLTYGLPITVCSEVLDTQLYSGHSDIDLSSGVEKYANKLSRVLPKPIEGVRFICLPALTDLIYEKEDTSNSLSSYPDVKHNCNNSMVIEHNARMQNSSITGKSVLFNLQYVNSGKITGSNTLHNIFMINNGKDQDYNITLVSGISVENYFYFNGYIDRVKLVFSNDSVNIINIEHSKSYLHVSKFMCTNGSIIIMQTVHKKGKLTDDLRVYSKAVDPKDKFSIYYTGPKKARDDIHCNYEAHNAEDNSDRCEYIDTGGGTIDDIDFITGCRKVIIRPYTSYLSKTNAASNETSHTLYFGIKTDGYESDKNSFANISLSSTDRAHIALSNISVLLDTKEVVYISQNQTLIMKFLLSQGGVFTLYLEPYVVSNLNILDKDGYINPAN